MMAAVCYRNVGKQVSDLASVLLTFEIYRVLLYLYSYMLTVYSTL